MVINHKPTGRSVSMPAGLAAGGILAMGLTIAGSALIAKTVEREILSEEKIGYAIMVLLIAVSYFSALLSYSKIKRRRLLTCMLMGAVYMAILMATTALFFGGQYTAVLETALLIFCGSMLASLPGTVPKSRAGKRKIKIPNR